MARLISCGFELNSNTLGMEPTIAVGGSIVTTPVHGGQYACSFSSSSTDQTELRFSAGNNTGPFFARIYLAVTSLPNALTTIIALSANAGAFQLTVKLSSSGTLGLYDNNDVQVGSNSQVLNLNQYYCVELKLDALGGAGTNIGEGRIEGGVFATSSALSFASGIQILYIGKNLKGETATGTVVFDDIAINDTTGSFQNYYPGPGKIVHLKPILAGDSNTFTVQIGGVAGSANNFTRVNEIPPDDSTSYNADAVGGDIDDFAIEDTPSSILITDVINVVSIGVRYAALVALLESSLKVRVKKVSGGTVSKSNAITPSSVSFVTNANASPFISPLTLYQDPDGANWLKSTLDTAQVGYEISTGNTNASAISNIWLLVDYATIPIAIGQSVPGVIFDYNHNVEGY